MARKRTDSNGNVSGSALKLWIEQQEAAKQGAGVQAGGGDWREVDPAYIVRLVVSVTGQGGAVLFGLDRQRFLYCIQLFVDGSKYSKFFHPVNEYEAMLEWIEKTVQVMDNL